MRSKIIIMGISGLLLLLNSCSEDGFPTDGQSNNTLITNYSKHDLNARLKLPEYEEMMSFYDVPNHGTHARRQQQYETSEENYTFILRAEVEPPVYHNRSLRASHVSISGNRAFVAYNTEGETYLGGVDLFDISNIQSPALLAQVIVDGTDFSAVAYHNNKIYLAGARALQEDDTLQSPAIVEILEVENDQIVGEPVLLDVSGFTATDVKVHNNKLYVTSGTNGGLSIFDINTLALLKSTPMDDARSLAFEQDEFVLMQGTPARITTYNNVSGAQISTYTPGGASIPESKSIVDMKGHLIYVPAGREGLKVIHGNTGAQKLTVPLPTIEEIKPEFVVTNGVSINNNKVFIANGAAGCYVAEQQGENIALLGSMNFKASVNYVESKGDAIFIATGTGGLKIIEIMTYVPEAGDYITIGSWDDNGIPDYLCESGSTIDPQLMENIFDELVSRSDVTARHPEWFASTAITDLALIKDTDVTITFLHEGAGYQNTLSYYTYPTEHVPASTGDVQDFTVLFPNVSYKNQAGALERGDKVCLQKLKAGTSLGFLFNVNSFHKGTLSKGAYSHHTTLALNTTHPAGLKQNSLLLYDEASDTIILAIEDIPRPGGDKDYEDGVFLIKLSNPEAVDTSKLTRLK